MQSNGTAILDYPVPVLAGYSGGYPAKFVPDGEQIESVTSLVFTRLSP